MVKMYTGTSLCTTEVLQDTLFAEKKISVSILRLDKIHPIVSGNKLFKLHYFLEQALTVAHQPVLTFGGAYSNHLLATAYACRILQLRSIGIVRGEQPQHPSFTLQECAKHGMKIKFVPRKIYDYKEDEQFISRLKKELGDCTIIPEGGYHPLGAKGAALIPTLMDKHSYTHIYTATGTATTLAGLLMSTQKGQTITSVNILKGMTDIKDRLRYLCGPQVPLQQLTIVNDYHFGGYAKKNATLIQFMNQCWQKFCLPLDFVYTAKMLYALTEHIKNDHFPIGSSILCIHTGGLQGNCSLPSGTLLY